MWILFRHSWYELGWPSNTGMYESFVNCESVAAADAELVILEVRNQLIFGHKNRFKDARNQVEAPKCSEK